MTASMWQTNGFMVDRNLHKLGILLKDKGIDCIIPDSNDSEQICNKCLEKDRIFLTSNLKLFNRKAVIWKCCVHYKDNP